VPARPRVLRDRIGRAMSAGHIISRHEQRRDVSCLAKKKGGKKKGGPKKKESKFSALTKEKAASESKVVKHESTEVILDLLLLVENYAKKVGKPFPTQGAVEITSIAKEIWNAPFVLLYHRLPQEGEGEYPTFCYVNKAALALFETTWDEFVGMESRKTAEDEAAVQQERDEYLAKSLAEGCVEGLEVWRVSQKGKRFLLKDVVLWNIDSGDETIGQAAICREWQYEDESVGNVETLFGGGGEGGEGGEGDQAEEEEAGTETPAEDAAAGSES